MAYVPPHKRHENVAVRAFFVPPSLLTNPGTDDRTILYAKECISRFFFVGSQDDDKFQLVPVSSEWKRDTEEKSLVILVNSEFVKLENPWLLVAEKMEDDLILGFGKAREMLQGYGSSSEDVKVRLIARFGKVLFHSTEPRSHMSRSTTTLLHGSPESVKDGPLEVSTLKKLKKSFQTNVPKSYVENIGNGVVRDMGFSVEKTKELYLVKVSDKTRPDVTIFCKCKVDQEQKRLDFFMADLNVSRHVIIDVSCLDQDLDFRLMVDSKRTLNNLSENEIKNLKKLTDSALIDPNVKGGLRWPFGKSSCADRYRVCGVWHIVTSRYRKQTLKLQITEADRYDFRTDVGETSREVNLKLKGLCSTLLKEDNVERECVSDMLKDCLKEVWDYFLKAV